MSLQSQLTSTPCQWAMNSVTSIIGPSDVLIGAGLPFALASPSFSISYWPFIGFLLMFLMKSYRIPCSMIIAFITSHQLSLGSWESIIFTSIFLFTERLILPWSSMRIGEAWIFSFLSACVALKGLEDNLRGWLSFTYCSVLSLFVWSHKVGKMNSRNTESKATSSKLYSTSKNISFATALTQSSLIIVLIAMLTLDHQSHLQWLFQEISRESQRLLIFWPLSLLATVLFPVFKQNMFVEQNLLRKWFHFAAVGLFIPAAVWNLKLLKVSMACALLLLLQLELCRNVCGRAPQFLNAFMERCRNDLDRGQVVLSHIFLLLGCAIPCWLSDETKSLQAISGIIVLGLGDAMASIGGKAFGRHLWSDFVPIVSSRKTVEGSICAFLAIFTAFTALNPVASRADLAMIAGGAALWEAFTDLNDNVTLPLFTVILFKQCT